MGAHKIVLDDVFDEVSYTLLAIHCSLEDFRVAFLLNKNLDIHLKRKPTDIDFNGLTHYPIFEWDDSKQGVHWSLVSNICKLESLQNTAQNSLFDAQDTITKTAFLLPEHKKVNYLLKIETECSLSKEKYILNRILNIPQIVTAYSINQNTIKSKDNLIFN